VCSASNVVSIGRNDVDSIDEDGSSDDVVKEFKVVIIGARVVTNESSDDVVKEQKVVVDGSKVLRNVVCVTI